MKKNSLKSAVLALTLTSVIVTTTAPTFAVSIPNPSAVAYSTSSTISQEELLAMTASINEKAAVVEDLTWKVNAKREELDQLYIGRISDKTVVHALRTLLSTDTAEMVSQLESDLTELTALHEEFSEVESELRDNIDGLTAYLNAQGTIAHATIILSTYKNSANRLDSAINSFEAKANS